MIGYARLKIVLICAFDFALEFPNSLCIQLAAWHVIIPQFSFSTLLRVE